MAITAHRQCPWCFSGDIFKSGFRGLEYILPLLLLRPVRCRSCLRRHYRLIFYRTPKRHIEATVPKREDKLSA